MESKPTQNVVLKSDGAVYCKIKSVLENSTQDQ
jgi:hypothetical protein